MSRLSVYWPVETGPVSVKSEDRMIIPFPNPRIKANCESLPMDVVTRARALYKNRRCHDCGYPVVEPIELPDSTINHTGMSIPGTATLVGFRCIGCQNEWSI